MCPSVDSVERQTIRHFRVSVQAGFQRPNLRCCPAERVISRSEGNFQSDMRIGRHGRLTNPRCGVRASRWSPGNILIDYGYISGNGRFVKNEVGHKGYYVCYVTSLNVQTCYDHGGPFCTSYGSLGYVTQVNAPDVTHRSTP